MRNSFVKWVFPSFVLLAWGRNYLDISWRQREVHLCQNSLPSFCLVQCRAENLLCPPQNHSQSHSKKTKLISAPVVKLRACDYCNINVGLLRNFCTENYKIMRQMFRAVNLTSAVFPPVCVQMRVMTFDTQKDTKKPGDFASVFYKTCMQQDNQRSLSTYLLFWSFQPHLMVLSPSVLWLPVHDLCPFLSPCRDGFDLMFTDRNVLH